MASRSRSSAGRSKATAVPAPAINPLERCPLACSAAEEQRKRAAANGAFDQLRGCQATLHTDDELSVALTASSSPLSKKPATRRRNVGRGQETTAQAHQAQHRQLLDRERTMRGRQVKIRATMRGSVASTLEELTSSCGSVATSHT